MKSTFALVGAYAALASAFTPGRHLHFPRGNSTGTAPPTPAGSITTLTVQTTRTSTIISCAPTVTNCPAGKPEMSTIPESDRQIKTVTETVDLTTTVCPVAEASTISQQIIEKHKSASSAAAPSQTQPPVQTTDIISTKTITLTMGSGDRQSVVPTVITTTIKSTITPPAGASKTNEETVTTTATSTSTKTVTITRAKATPSAAAGNNNGGNGNSGNGEKCASGAAPATVTVTVAQTTVTAAPVTVTVSAPCAATSAPAGSKQVEQEKPAGKDNNSKPAGGEKAKASQPPAEASTTPCESDSTTTIEATVTVVPYPANNGTTPTATGAPAPSGFARLRR
ncbi:hypothetical protein LMH87_000432 [Akanthomyces muscarius]|uniref:Lustrin A n=1 Tax=Akanthomyces muscarius TaxID=2231603 RepID=A0A9W8QHB1_AKAMU|nr:hypothetical protein LMH87_000432 [Akanthomyces muscarius]KAJ4155175.1 hypothetical protein LMH87_000432 [Akanthomyces muscarius]